MTDDLQSLKAKPARRRFTQLIDALERVKARYAICGAVALGAHGAERYTQDIDVLVAAEDLDRVVGALAGSMVEVGREPASGDAKHVRLRSKRARGPRAVDLDLMAPIDAIEAWAIATSVRGRAFERKVDLVSAEALVVMKLNAYLDEPASHRGMQHLSDARRLLAIGTVDLSALRRFVRSHPKLAAELARSLAAPPPKRRYQ